MNNCAQNANQVTVHALDNKIFPISGSGGTDHNLVQGESPFVPSDHPFSRGSNRQDMTGDCLPESSNSDFAKTLASAICDAFSLSKVSLPTFNGYPLQFHEFMTNFQINTDNRSLPPETKLAYLFQM